MATKSKASTVIDVKTMAQTLDNSIYLASYIPSGGVTIDNIRDVQESIFSNNSARNAFYESLFDVINKTIISTASMNSRLGEYKQGLDNVGNYIQENFIGRLKAKKYKENITADDFLGIEKVPVDNYYHKLNRQEVYKFSLQQDEISLAMQTTGTMSDLIAKITSAPMRSNNIDESMLFKKLWSDGYRNRDVPLIEVGEVETEEQLRELSATIRETFSNLQWPNRKNPWGIETAVEDPNSFSVVLTNRVLARLSTMSYSSAYNRDDVTLPGILKEGVDSFDDPNIVGVAFDNGAMIVADKINKMESDHIAANMVDQYFFHIWQWIHRAVFIPQVMFVKKAPIGYQGRILPVETINFAEATDTEVSIPLAMDAFNENATGYSELAPIEVKLEDPTGQFEVKPTRTDVTGLDPDFVSSNLGRLALTVKGSLNSGDFIKLKMTITTGSISSDKVFTKDDVVTNNVVNFFVKVK